MLQAPLKRFDHGLGSIRDLEAHQNPGDMRLHGGFFDAEFFADLAIALARDNQTQNLTFSMTQVRVGEALGKSSRNRGRQESVAMVHPQHGLH